MATNAANRIRPITISLSGWMCGRSPDRSGWPRPGKRSHSAESSQATVAKPNITGTATGMCVAQISAAPARQSTAIHEACATALSTPASLAFSQPPATSKSKASTTLNQVVGSKSSAASTSAASTSEVITRDLSMLLCVALGKASEAPLALPEIVQRRIQVGLGEVRPERIAEMEFGIGKIPQQVIGKPALSAGPDEQVRFRLARKLERVAECGLVDAARIKFASARLLGESARGRHDVVSSAVARCDVEQEAGVVAGHLLGARHTALQGFRKRFSAANEVQAHTVLVELVNFTIQRPPEQAHQTRDFVARTAPVFAGKRIDGQNRNATLAHGPNDLACNLGAGLVAIGARLAPPGGPPAVAVHDDCQMMRQICPGHRLRSP